MSTATAIIDATREAEGDQCVAFPASAGRDIGRSSGSAASVPSPG